MAAAVLSAADRGLVGLSLKGRDLSLSALSNPTVHLPVAFTVTGSIQNLDLGEVTFPAGNYSVTPGMFAADAFELGEDAGFTADVFASKSIVLQFGALPYTNTSSPAPECLSTCTSPSCPGPNLPVLCATPSLTGLTYAVGARGMNAAAVLSTNSGGPIFLKQGEHYNSSSTSLVMQMLFGYSADSSCQPNTSCNGVCASSCTYPLMLIQPTPSTFPAPFNNFDYYAFTAMVFF